MSLFGHIIEDDTGIVSADDTLTLVVKKDRKLCHIIVTTAHINAQAFFAQDARHILLPDRSGEDATYSLQIINWHTGDVVRSDISLGENIYIEGGIKDNEWICISQPKTVVDGMKVTPVTETDE